MHHESCKSAALDNAKNIKHNSDFWLCRNISFHENTLLMGYDSSGEGEVLIHLSPFWLGTSLRKLFHESFNKA